MVGVWGDCERERPPRERSKNQRKPLWALAYAARTLAHLRIALCFLSRRKGDAHALPHHVAALVVGLGLLVHARSLATYTCCCTAQRESESLSSAASEPPTVHDKRCKAGGAGATERISTHHPGCDRRRCISLANHRSRTEADLIRARRSTFRSLTGWQWPR